MYTLYFLLDRSKSLVPKDVVETMLQDPFFSYSVTEENDLIIKYKDNNIIFEANIYFKTKSVLPNLHLLNPQYKNINISLELSPLIPKFKLNLFLDKLAVICQKFDLHIYCEFLNDVQAFKKEDILYTYDMYKKAYMVKYPDELKELYIVDRMKLSDYLLYENEYTKVKKLYAESNIVVPKILYYVEEGTKNVKITIEWDGLTNIIVPPFVDYILYQTEEDRRYLIASEFNTYLGKYMTNVPGFIPGTKVITEKKLKKCQKAISKAKFSRVLKKFKVVLQTNLID